MKINFLDTPIARGAVWALPALLCILLAGACKPEKQGSDRMQEVVAVHDSVMPKMSRIGQLVATLKPLADSTAEGRAYQQAMVDLQEAHQSMMDWMKGFGDRFDYAEIMEGKELSAEKARWLEEEAVKVQAMAEQVNGSIARAEELLENRAPSE